jgi:hypothetical protein
MTGTDQRPGAVNLDNANAACPGGKLVLYMAQGGDFDPVGLGRLKNGRTVPDPDFFSINAGIHITHLHTSKERILRRETRLWNETRIV